jgi:hypothetical protein
LCLFNFSIALSTSKALDSSTSHSDVCISVCLTSLTPCTFNSWEKWFLHLAKYCESLQPDHPSHPLLYSFYAGTLLKVTDVRKCHNTDFIWIFNAVKTSTVGWPQFY